MAGAPTKQGIYRRRRPETSTLYQVVQHNLETWLARSYDELNSEKTIPAHVEKEFRHYLDCGILAHGFARVRCEGCGYNYLVAFSCKGRGLCPSCNTQHMVQTASHMIDMVFPAVPVRQWVLSLPKRIRYYVYHSSKIANGVLKILQSEIEKTLRCQCELGQKIGRLGGVTFMQRFGSSLNVHAHYHCCVIDGLFERRGDQLIYHQAKELTKSNIRETEKAIQSRVLRYFKRHELLTADEVQNMKTWPGSGGFSLHGEVLIASRDRKGRERLIRYCARPAFASERLQRSPDGEHLDYWFKKPSPTGEIKLRLTPLELLDKLAQLIPPPRKHRHHYHGVLAPNSPSRKQVTAHAGKRLNSGEVLPRTEKASANQANSILSEVKGQARKSWAMLLARIYEVFPLICPQCKSEMKIIAFVTESQPIKQILDHIGESSQPPSCAQARGPPEESAADQYEEWQQSAPIEAEDQAQRNGC